ncbi:hypothetical protein IOE58_08715 [Brachybacterium sp. Marseille-Q2903]|uniref:Uncharacterized protein n=2 Tax=Brachybacterium TaxID=43668 RepID=A0ABR9W1G3_9MICO|nr:hypothetical protein [Brachybacterium epidermidis]MBE9404262.1 hypothetical protein [Brachybacterium epidermidis]
MIMILGEEPTPPYTEPRGTCPDCGSARVRHHLLGMADPRTDPPPPDWVDWHGCLLPFGDRSCEECDNFWRVGWLEEPHAPMRLVSADGAAFALLPVPDLEDDGVVEVDIELLTSDRLVRYLHRAPEEGALSRLGGMLQDAAKADLPEVEVPSFQDEESELAVLVLDSDPLTVTLEILVAKEPGSEEREVDAVAFDVTRADLISASYQIWAWEE